MNNFLLWQTVIFLLFVLAKTSFTIYNSKCLDVVSNGISIFLH